MLSFLSWRALPTSLGFLLLASFIWLSGPYFAFGQYRPLETPIARLVAIGLLAVGWLVWKLLKRLRARRASDKLVTAVVTQARAEERPSAEAVQLRERFEEAVATLKQKRRGRQSLYELPWYVIIGAPGSGKTTALVNSGLHFPLEQRSGRGALRGVGGTRNCDWWFTDEAVFLDTAGRYTTQDSDAGADSAGWSEFLALLRKYRKRRPVNGIILTISAHDLMTQNHAAREAHVAAARRRLNELNKELRIQLPVYLMVTKCDLVAGFTEYFDDLAQDGRAQVWGMTFPYDQTMKGEAVKVYPAEFDALVERLNARLYARLEEERDARRSTRVFGFPQQMAALRDLLGAFVADVFASTRFDQQVLLRGIYFTSGTQEGTPIDRLLGAIGRRFGVTPDAVASPGGRGKAYFIERLLKEVLFAESGLAGVNRRLEVQKAAAEVGAYAAMIVLTILGVVLLSVSYSRNRTYVDEVAADVARLEAVPPIGQAASLETVLPRLDAVGAVSESANRFAAEGGPWSMRWGLFQGASIGNAARDAYTRELDGALLPQVAARIRERLVDYVPEPEKLYEYLKAYLMLGDPSHLDKAQLGYIADLEWKSLDSADPEAGAALSKHFASLLDDEDSLRAVELDQALIAQARTTIRGASIGGLIYRHVRLGYASDTSRALRLDISSGVGADRVLRRKSGLPLSEPIRSLYTAPVFREITGRGTDDLIRQFTADQWVWGEGGIPRVGTDIAAEFNAIYEKDYIAFWDGVVKDVEPVPMATLERTKDALAILAAPTSPLRGFLKTVDEHTYLVKPPDPAQVKPGLTGRLGDIFNRGKAAIGLSTIAPGTEVTAHFAEIHNLVASEKGPAPIDGVLMRLQQIQQKLEPVGAGVGQTDPLDPVTVNSVGELANTLKREAAALPPTVGAILTEVANRTSVTIRRGVTGTIDIRYKEDVLRECVDVTEGRYPFVPTSTVDVPLADFGRLFGYNGVFDTFFKNELERFVDASRAPWTWRADAAGMSVGPSAVMLRQFETAQRIREMFFRPGGQEPEVRFRLTPTDLDVGATRFLLEIDSQSFENRHGPERSWQATWPGPSPGPAAATFDSRSGGRPNIVFQGSWAWFRLIDAIRADRETGARYVLTFAKDGHEARVRIEAASIRNPFGKDELQQFRCAA